MRGMRITRRGWAAITFVAMLVGGGIGVAVSPGDNPCDWYSTVECTR